MVNVPPIPPLLCSTPPPIDFGDDEDLDSMNPSLDDVEDDFGGFLVDDGIKADEHLPSPRPPSACDLPSISIYDSLMLPEEEEFTRHAKAKSISITEAFNFEVKNSIQDERNKMQAQSAAEHVQPKTETENVSSKIQEIEPSIQSVYTTGLSKNFKDLKIEPVNDAVQCIVNKSSEENIQNVVSIEDIEDDLSDDELYSPKTPTNFTEADNITDLFKIEEIKTVATAGNNIELGSKVNNSKSWESNDNNKSDSLTNTSDKEFKSFSSNCLKENQFDKPPPLPGGLNSIDNEVDDDDFGAYSDFQETHFVNNAVPVEKVYVNRHKQNFEITDLNELSNFGNAEDYSDFNSSQIETNGLEHAKMKDKKMRKDFENVPFNNSSLNDKFDIKDEELVDKKNDKFDSLRAENENCKEDKINNANNENNLPIKQLSYEDNSLSDLSEVAAIDDNEGFGMFAEFPCIPPPETVKTAETKATSFSDDDEFSDFADFASNQAPQLSAPDDVKKADDNDDDDDDFGDFNTAEPFASTAPPSSIVKNNASQNINSQNPVTVSHNINERISKILQLMFKPTSNLAEGDSDEFKSDKIQDIPFTSIDAAKALEYQWLNSDTRHSFIRSLGIDSRNILYGDNWNPALPRFAANLSFNPLKPMKPLPSPNITENTISALDTIPVTSAETNRAIELSTSIKKETFDLDWKSPIAEEQTIEALKDNNIHAPIDAASSLPYISDEPQTNVTESIAIFENTFDNEGKLPKTPPISEMESVTSFTSPLPGINMSIDLPTPQADLAENANSLNVNEVVATSTFTGSFKETHIYTPSKTNDFEIKHAIATPPTSSSSPTKSSPIDFDYEKAAMGVIIDETVVKKEYRDVEYNPRFTMDSLSKSVSPKIDIFEANTCGSKNLTSLNLADNKKEVDREDGDANDDFSEFQSVSSEVALPTTSKPLEVPKTTTLSHGGMILSPAILIPQAISLENQKPKIEWGDSAATINPEELARIEELFPEPKSLKSTNSSQKSTPTHQVASAPSISATVATKELEGNINNRRDDDDDDWSDFVSVTVTNNHSANRTGSNNNVLARSPAGTPFQQRSPIVTNKMPPPTAINSNNDDEWSDFVSSAPAMQQPHTYRVPQFNSGAWQNANFYNNPLSMYHKGPLNIPTTAATTHSSQKYVYNNNNNYNVSQQPYSMANSQPSTTKANHQQPIAHNSYKQQIHVMQNFSTAPMPTPERLSAAAAAKNNQLQSIGSAKVAPSIALIPDLGFVAPAIPTHTSFINSLPKPSINMKK